MSCNRDLFFKYISLQKIIKDEIITRKAPINVLIVGISFHIKYPNIIAKTKPRYFNGVTKPQKIYTIELTIN